MGKSSGEGFRWAPMADRRGSWTWWAPLGPMYQAGTLSGNPLAMAAGYAQLRYLKEHPGIYAQLDVLSGQLVAGVAAAAKAAAVRWPITA